MRVIVVGGGIGGMAVAGALQRAGVDVTIVERAPALGEVGAGVFTTSNGVRALDYLGCHDAIRRSSVQAEGQLYLGLEDDRELLHVLIDAEADRRFGAPAYFIHRADLLSALQSTVDPTRVRVASKVVGVEQTAGGAAVVLESGERLEADLVVGADGINSAVRSATWGESEARYTNIVAWRATIPMERLSHLGLEPNYQHMWTGPGRSVVSYAVRGGKHYNFAGFVPAAEAARESWAMSGDIDQLKASYAGANPRLRGIIDAIDEAFLTGLYFRDPLESWVAGRVVVLGDAAHPMLPFAGQGATMALEDAVTLGILVGRAEGDLDAALQRYQRLRQERTTQVLELSRQNALLLSFEDDEKIRARDGRYRGLRQIDPTGWAVRGWLAEHDVVAAATRDQTEVELPRSEAQARAAGAWAATRTSEDRSGSWLGERAAYDRTWQGAFDLPASVEAHALERATVTGWALVPEHDEGDLAVLYVHGGGYSMGSSLTGREVAARLAVAVTAPAWSIDYRLAPEAPYPAGLDDVHAAYLAIRDEFAGRRILIAGDDAGAGLALALTQRLIAADEQLPDALHLVSPMLDLTVSSETVGELGGVDPWWDRRALIWASAGYRHDHDARDVGVSPLFGELGGLPPTLVHYAAEESLAGDARRFAEAARRAGSEVEAHGVSGSVHAFTLFPYLPETGDALRDVARLADELRREPASSPS